MARVLVVDDEMTMVQMVTEVLRSEGHEVFPYNNGNAALEAIENHAPDLGIADLNLERSRTQGLDILQKARTLNPPAVVIVITGFGTVETAVEAMKKGAFDYLEKPFKIDDFKLAAQRALSYTKAISENVYLRKQLRDKYQFDQIVGTAPPMQAVFRMIEKVADTDSTILILGESGTGKELVARALHFNSRRQFAPFVPINCSALPENLLESELFGHRRGAFTGAINDKKGLFQEADGGTIFLDEIGSMPPVLQSRLLRVLQDREVRKVGDNTPVYVNVRVLSATNEPLEEKIKNGTFREDLYYRLNVIPIRLPSLRERLEDIPLLVAHFLKRKVHPRTSQPYQLTRQVMAGLMKYDWPGNVRELENVIERACALCEESLIELSDLPAALQMKAAVDAEPTSAPLPTPPIRILPDPVSNDGIYPLPQTKPAAAAPVRVENAPNHHPAGLPAPGSHRPVEPLKDYLREQEFSYLNQVLNQTGGDKDRAASMLGISLATLYRKLAERDSP
ncbi:MAG TPA: sigma-54 dependent transcriptional regulator [Verrucomicrobiae bacterium]|nr:sigma-54 dependent transcriptional regulator [Verrucomicrobiae bacterium]